MRKLLKLTAYTTLVILFVGAGIGYLNQTDIELNIRGVELQSDKSKLKILQSKYQDLNLELEKSKNDKKKIKQLESRQKKLEAEKQRLEKDLLSKKKLDQTSTRLANIVTGTKTVSAGNCDTWLAQAGVTDVANAKELIRRESGCNPNAVNPSSGACGISQSLPCSKMGAVNEDGTSAVSPVNQIIWMRNYVMIRYGSWEGAVAFHDKMNWY